MFIGHHRGKAGSSFGKKPCPQTSQASAQPGVGEPRAGVARFVASWIKLFGLGERVPGRPYEAQHLLASANLQPKQKVARIPFNRLLQQLESKRELLIV